MISNCVLEAWGGDLVENDAKTIKVMEKILDNEFPNLVVFNGDLLTGEAVMSHNYTNYIVSVLLLSSLLSSY